MADFDPMTSVQQGANFMQGITDEGRKTAAYNALKNTYGDIAGDPDSALKLQEYGQRGELNPIAVDQAKANLTTTNQTNSFNALADPLKLTGLSDTNANTEATTENTKATTANTQEVTKRSQALLPGEVAQQGATLANTRASTGLTNAQTATSRLALNTAQAAQDRASTMGIISALSDTASAGGDIGAKFDELAPLIAKFEGHDGADLAPLRASLVADPVGTINRLSTAIQAAQMTATGGKGSVASQLAMYKVNGQQMSLRDGLNFIQQRTANIPNLADQMNGLVGTMADNPTVRVAKSKVPGTPEYQFEALVHQLTPNLALDDIRTLKGTGTSFGRVSNMEMSMAGNAIANMDMGQDKATLRANLARIKNTYSVVNSDVAGAIKRAGSGVGGAAHATAPDHQIGQVYIDKNGTKAVWNGKSFVEQQ